MKTTKKVSPPTKKTSSRSATGKAKFALPSNVKKTINQEIKKVVSPSRSVKSNSSCCASGSCFESKKGSACSFFGEINYARMLMGLILIIIGLLYLGQNLGIIPFQIKTTIFNLWPLLIVIMGLFLVDRKLKMSILVWVLGVGAFVCIISFIFLYAFGQHEYDLETVPGINVRIEKQTSIPTPITAIETTSSEAIKLKNLVSGQVVKSPIEIEGEALGAWFFEGFFPVKVLDENGNELGVGQARAIGDWMTDKMVSFETSIYYKKPLTAKGILVFERDNPSGLAGNVEKYMIPVNFK
jgi:hypothetical protein